MSNFSREEFKTNNRAAKGYDVELHGTLEERYKCIFCNKLMREPIQTCRGELSCFYCYNEAKGNADICPIDGQPINHGQIFQDRCQALEIMRLNCYCGYRKIGCNWIGEIAHVEEHEISCSYQPTKCFVCGDQVYLPTIEQHLIDCRMIKNATECIYANSGCSYKPSNGEELLNHLKNNDFVHTALLFSVLHRRTEEKNVLHGELNTQKKHSTDIQCRLQNEIEFLKDKVSAMATSIVDITSKFENISSKFEHFRKLSSNNTDFKEHSCLNSNDIKSLSNNVSAINTTVSDINLRQQLLENTSFDGRIIWKIDHLKVRMQQAITGRVTALHSAPGFTSKYGYKFCARLYLNGDGMGKSTHLSLFFVLMKSEYDNLLAWPFNHRVSFHLINQEDSSRSIKESFSPDRNSSSFQKPKKEMNVAAGCPMFISKEEFLNGGFLKDDSLFIEITAK